MTQPSCGILCNCLTKQTFSSHVERTNTAIKRKKRGFRVFKGARASHWRPVLDHRQSWRFRRGVQNLGAHQSLLSASGQREDLEYLKNQSATPC